MVTGGIRSASKSDNIKYLRSRRRFPLRVRPQTTTTPNAIDLEYDKLKQHIQIQAPEVDRQAKQPWISKNTWKLIDKRTSKSKTNSFQPGERQRLARRIKRALNRDRKQRTENAGNAIEQHLKSGRLKAAWNVLQRWYKHSGDRPPRPTRTDLNNTSNEYRTLYQTTQPPGEPFTTHIDTPFPVDDDIPTEQEIADAIRNLKNGKAPGHSGIRAEHLKELLRQAKKEEATDDDRKGWEQICKTIQEIFATGAIPTEMTWSILVLIPKASGGTRGIGLLEVMWKVCSAIINKRLQQSITFHEALHGFCKEHGTGTATLDAKLQMQLAHIRGIPLYQIFLDLSKAYDTMNRERTITILQAYGVGERVIRLLTNFWNSLTVVARQQGYYGRPFKAERGTTQGDIVSPTIFNVLVDAVIREWFVRLDHENLSDKVTAVFYADDGHLYGTDADALQRATDLIVALFECVGLQANATKTKAMVCAPRPSVTRISSPAYKRRMNDHDAPTYRERKRQQVTCDICNANMQARSLNRHKRLKHGLDPTLIPQQDTPPHLATADANTYMISMPNFNDIAQCPVPGCNTVIKTRIGMRRHFLYRHFQDTIVIMEEGRLSRCTRCGMFCTEFQFACGHTNTILCKQGTKRNRQKMRDLQCIRAF
jgi:hypothetical protein